jgi:predicted alpha-1,6-mannanase (GH76 family)
MSRKHSSASQTALRGSVAAVVAVIAATTAIPEARADLNSYGVPADNLQNSAFSRFRSPDGLYFLQNNGGNAGFNYWWMAHGIDGFIDAFQRTRDATYLTRAKTLLHGVQQKNGGGYVNAFYDDMGWMGLACLRAYAITGDTEYLSVSETLWAQIKTGFSSGLFSWSTSCQPNCKNTIGSTPAIILGARLFGLGVVPAADRTMVETAYTNVKSTLVDPTTGAVWDGKDLGTGAVNKATYSYNQGMFIGAGLELYKLSGNTAFIADAQKTADWATTAFTVNGLVFAQKEGGGDGGLFKGILIRYLALFAREASLTDADRSRYIRVVKANANLLHATGIQRPEMLVGPDWSTPPGTVTDYSSQLSGIFLEEAAAIVETPIVYRDFNYLGAWSSLPAGSYTLAQLNARGVANDDITSITVPPGWTVTMYENDNFTGASLVRTSNDTFLSSGAWNDRVSSLVVSAPASAAVATVYQDCNSGGYAVDLPVGDYDMFALQRAGVVNDDISSFRLTAGHTLSLFQEFNFTGTQIAQTASNSCLVGIGFNDTVSSLKLTTP